MKTDFSMILLAALCLASSASAQSARDEVGVVGFRSPSGNIHCQYFEGSSDKPPSANALRCDIKTLGNAVPPRPKDCDLDYGRAFEMNDRGGPALRLCYGDTAMDDRLPVLGYGAVWQRGGISCKSEQSGVSCTNTNGNGFALSRNAQRLF